MMQAYQDRIVQLRQEVDRLHSRQYAQAGGINLQLQELAQQQDMLAEQHQYVRALVDKAGELGIQTAQSAPVPADKSLITGALLPTASEITPDIEDMTQSVQSMMRENRLALAGLSDAAAQSTDQIITELGKIGISANLSGVETDGIGGPFIPNALDDPTNISLVDDANAAMLALKRFTVARDIAAAAPVFEPLKGKIRQTSRFGSRKDPFLGKMAFHAGVDFGAPSGTTVYSAGEGTVKFVGRKSGYGNVVEVQHANGLLTRYGHLSAFIAHEGQRVEPGTAIARVGSTGRSTGPHLHFEVRRNNEAIDPSGFLKAGNRLAKFL